MIAVQEIAGAVSVLEGDGAHAERHLVPVEVEQGDVRRGPGVLVANEGARAEQLPIAEQQLDVPFVRPVQALDVEERGGVLEVAKGVRAADERTDSVAIKSTKDGLVEGGAPQRAPDVTLRCRFEQGGLIITGVKAPDCR